MRAILILYGKRLAGLLKEGQHPSMAIMHGCTVTPWGISRNRNARLPQYRP